MRAFITILVLWIVIGAGPAQGESAAIVSPHSEPISIIASTTGRFAKGHGWHLSINSAGKAHLTIATYPEKQTREFQISKAQMDAFAELIEKERFFDLKAEYGERVPDGSTRMITVVQGNKARTVSVHFLMNFVRHAPAKLKEPARAVRVLEQIRGWFDDKEAVDLRGYDWMVIDAAGKQ